MTILLEPPAIVATPQPGRAVDPAAFAELFLDVDGNRDEIWVQMGLIADHAARGIKVRSKSDLPDVRGEAFYYAMANIGKYDPARGTAYFYFYQLLKNHMWYLANRGKSFLFLGDAAFELSEDDFRSPSDVDKMSTARTGCSNNWRSFQVTDESRPATMEYFQGRMRELQGRHGAASDPGERAALAVMIKTIRMMAVDFVG